MNDRPAISDNDPALDELVAYLDGELDEPEREQVERRLASDSVYRDQLVQLQRSWDMLDHLPRATANQSFTQTTVEMIVVSTAQDVEHLKVTRTRSRLALWAGGCLVALLAGVIGYQLVASLLARPNERLAADLPVIENLDEYRYLDSQGVPFLVALDESGTFESSHMDEEPALVSHSMSAQLLADPLSVSADVKDELNRKRKRFEALAPSERQRLQDLHDDLESQPNAAHLRMILAKYNDWMSALPSTQRNDLLELPVPRRLEETRQIVQRQEEERFRAYVRATLNPDDHKHIHDWLRETVRRHEGAILESVGEDVQRSLLRTNPDDRRRRLLGHVFQPGRLGSFLAILDQRDWDELVGSLSREARREFTRQDTAEKRHELLLEWSRAAIFSRFRPSSEEMMRYLAERATPEDREKLENLPHERLQDELLKMYWRYRRGPGGRPPYGRPGSETRSGLEERRDRPGATRGDFSPRRRSESRSPQD